MREHCKVISLGGRGGGKRQFRLFLGCSWPHDYFLTKEMPLLGRGDENQGQRPLARPEPAPVQSPRLRVLCGAQGWPW